MQTKNKSKHNKKRNTAFLYESLIKELTRTIVDKNNETKNKIIGICKEFFSQGKPLQKELELYNVLNENDNLEPKFAERLLQEAVRLHSELDHKEIFDQQTKLIAKINKTIGPNVFNNFLPAYKNLATIYQIFNKKIPVKERILLEQNLLSTMTIKHDEDLKSKNMQSVDNIVYITFAKKFNEKYNNSLLTEQKQLLSYYVMSGTDEGIGLKVFLNEEIGRLKQQVNELLKTQEFVSNDFLVEKTNKLLEKLQSFRERQVDHEMLVDVLKIQTFVNEAIKQ